MNPRERARHLAALACNSGAAEGEANNAARALAKLVHETPEILDPAPEAALPPTVTELDPLVGMAVREGASLVGDLLRDWLRPKKAEPRSPDPWLTRPCAKCGKPIPGWSREIHDKTCQVKPKEKASRQRAKKPQEKTAKARA